MPQPVYDPAVEALAKVGGPRREIGGNLYLDIGPGFLGVLLKGSIRLTIRDL